MERTTASDGWKTACGEHLEALCSVIIRQAEIIREQAVFIDEQLTVDEALREHFAAKREEVDKKTAQLDSVLHPLACGSEERRTT